jgi:hypothetical protein
MQLEEHASAEEKRTALSRGGGVDWRRHRRSKAPSFSFFPLYTHTSPSFSRQSTTPQHSHRQGARPAQPGQGGAGGTGEEKSVVVVFVIEEESSEAAAASKRKRPFFCRALARVDFKVGAAALRCAVVFVAARGRKESESEPFTT